MDSEGDGLHHKADQVFNYVKVKCK